MVPRRSPRPLPRPLTGRAPAKRVLGLLVALALVGTALVTSPAAAAPVAQRLVAPTAVLDLPATAEAGSPVVADASRSSDPDGEITSYTFTLDGGSPVRTIDPTRTFTGLAPGRHMVTLVVTDDSGNESSPVTAEVVVRDTSAPTAVLDLPATAAAGSPVVADASRSTDVGGQVVSYTFTLDGGSPVRTTDPTRTYSGLAVGRHTVTLVVTDDSGNQSSPVTSEVVVADQTPPTAVLVAPTSVEAGRTIPLDGRKSSDRFGSVVQWVWTVGANAPVVTKTPTFTSLAVKEGPVLVSLVVVDSSGNRSSAAQAKVGVVPSGTKVTSFSGTTLIAPIDEVDPTYSTAARDLLAGRLYAERRTVVRATFRLVDGPVLGRSTTEVAGRTFSQLRAILDEDAAGRVAGLERFDVRLRMAVTVGSGDPRTVRRTISVVTRP